MRSHWGWEVEKDWIMPQDRSSATENNYCQSTTAISASGNNAPRPAILTSAKRLRRFGCLLAILALAWTMYYSYSEWHYYRVFEDEFFEIYRVERFLDTGSNVAFYLWQIAFGAIAISITIRSIREDTDLHCHEVQNESLFSAKHIAILILRWLPVFVGITFLCVNILGHSEILSRSYTYIRSHYWGWPIIHSGFHIANNTYFGTRDYGPYTRINFFSAYWTMFDFVVAGLIVLCSILVIKYAISRWSTKRQYSLKEILILITSTAFFLSFMMFDRSTSGGLGYTAKYHPVCEFPLVIQIPMLMGIACAAVVLGTAFFELFGLAIAKIFRLDDKAD